MRIVITNAGNKIVNELSDEVNTSRNDHPEILNSGVSPLILEKPNNQNLYKMNKIKINKINQNNTIQLGSNSKRHRNSKSMDFAVEPNKFESSKLVYIKQKKIHIPKNLTEKYNLDENYGYMLPNLNLNNIETQEESEKNKSPSYDGVDNKQNQLLTRDYYSFKEIVKKTAYNNLVKRLSNEENYKNRLSRVDENNFRSNYDKSKLEKFEDILDTKLESKSIALIKYINDKEDISDLFLKKVRESSVEKKNKANKICQIVFHEKEKEMSLNKMMREKINEKKNNELSMYKIQLENMKNSLKDSSEILKEYENFDYKNSKLRENQLDVMKKIWNKYNVDKFYHRKRSDLTHTINLPNKIDSNLNSFFRNSIQEKSAT